MSHACQYTLLLRCTLTVMVLLFVPFSAEAQVFRGYATDGTLLYRFDRMVDKEVLRRYFPDGTLKLIAPYKNNRLDGAVKAYHPNGVLKFDIPYHNGKRDGIARFYYDNGVLMAKVTYEKNRETGAARFYSAEGLPTKPSPLPPVKIPATPIAE